MNIYHVPRNGLAQAAYFDYVTGLPWAFNAASNLAIDPSYEHVTVDGTITGFTLVGTFTPSIVPAQTEMWNRIKAERDRIMLNGVLVSSKWFDTSVFSRTQWLGMLAMGAAVPAVLWKTKDGTFIGVTQTLVGQVFNAIATLDATVFAVAEAHRTAMLACADPYSYNWSGNWPATFVPV